MKRVFAKPGRIIFLSALTLTLSSTISMSFPEGHVKAYVEETQNPDGSYTYTDSDSNESITSKWMISMKQIM